MRIAYYPGGSWETRQARFETRGLNHLALVSGDMARTVDFYEGVLGMPLIKTIEIPGGAQHFFFDIGGGDSLAFFWFPNAARRRPACPRRRSAPGLGDIASGVGSMNHVALDVAPDAIDDMRRRLIGQGIDCSPVVNHDDSESGVSRTIHPGVFVRSVYFVDPDGINLEFAAWTRPLGPGDVRHAPVTADGRPRRAVGATAG